MQEEIGHSLVLPSCKDRAQLDCQYQDDMIDGSWRLSITMGRNETCHQKGQICRMKCTHETSLAFKLEARADVTVTDALTPQGRREQTQQPLTSTLAF